MKSKNDTLPRKYGIILFQAFESLDVFGPLNALQMVSREYKMDLSLISSTNLEPVTTGPRTPSMNPMNSSFFQSVVPTHTVDNPPDDLDVLLVPGGLGTIAPDINSTVDYIRDVYPSLQYIITVCTGARLAARAGVLDGKRATTNKLSYNRVTPLGPEVNWVPAARWTHDGKVWTSSGVSAGIDVTLAFIEEVYSADVAEQVANWMEYERADGPGDDPFAGLNNLTTQNEFVS